MEKRGVREQKEDLRKSALLSPALHGFPFPSRGDPGTPFLPPSAHKPNLVTFVAALLGSIIVPFAPVPAKQDSVSELLVRVPQPFVYAFEDASVGGGGKSRKEATARENEEEDGGAEEAVVSPLEWHA